MEDDVDIYADLPSFSFNPEKNNQDCNCKELKKEFDSLVNKLENIEKIKANLERNISSLLKTAKAEIARKDKMIDDLRKRLDDMTFRRGYRSEALDFSTHRLPHQYTATRKYEDIPSMHSQESKIESHQVQFQYDEYKNRKPQTDVNRIPTLFAERLQKRIMEDEKEDEKQKALLKLSVEPETKDIPKDIVENNKENGSHLNNNESDVKRCSNSESSERDPHRKNLMKRPNEEDDTRRHKRLKIENNEDKTTIEETNYNCLTQYEIDKPVQYKTKDSLVKFEDRLNPIHSFKKEEVSFSTGRRAASEYREQNRNYTRRNDSKNNSAKGHDNSNVRNDLADSSRNSRTASTSNYVSEEFNNGYKKNGYRHSPPRRTYSRSDYNRSDYENFSNHRLRERSSRTYREKKYDDYKYESRYKNSKLKRNYESEEGDGKTRYKRGERGVLRDRTRYSSSDGEGRESGSLYKNKKYENRRMKKEREMTIVSNDKKLHESNKAAAETNFDESSSRTTVNNTANYNVGKNIEEHKMKNESEIKSKNSIKNTSVKQNAVYLEEGEIVDSPEKKNNLAIISKDNKMKKNNIKSIPVEDKNEVEDIPVNAPIVIKLIPFQNVANSTKQEMADISTTKTEIVSCLLQENSKDIGKIIQSSSNKIDEADNCRKDGDTCKSYINEDLTDSIPQNVGATEQVCDINDNDENDIDKTSKDSITETAIAKTALTETKIKETANIESVIKIKELDDSSIENAKKEKVNNPNIESAIEMTEVNNFNSDNSIHKIDSDELRTSTAEVITKVEAMVNCDIEDRDKSQPPIESEILYQKSNKSNVETCLNDHNYVQKPFINVSDHDAAEKPSVKSESDEVETTTSKEMKMEKPINVQSVNSVKRTVSSTVKTKKDQQNKGRLISHRRKAVILSDSNASMTVLMNTQNTNVAKTSSITDDSNSALKPRACKILRVKLT